MDQENKQEQSKNYTGLRWLVTVVAILVLAIRIIYPALSIDAVFLGLIILALAPWLSPIFKSIEITGVGKVELNELEEKVQKLEGGVASLSMKTELTAITTVEKEFKKEDVIKAEKALYDLAAKYIDIRETLKAGNARTTLMTQIFGEMLQQAKNVERLDIDSLLRDKNPGQRLSAIAFVFTKPSPEMLNPVLDSVLSEVKPFNQYWGIQALKRIISQVYPNIGSEVEIKLRNLVRQLKSGTDRYYEAKSIVDDYLS